MHVPLTNFLCNLKYYINKFFHILVWPPHFHHLFIFENFFDQLKKKIPTLISPFRFVMNISYVEFRMASTFQQFNFFFPYLFTDGYGQGLDQVYPNLTQNVCPQIPRFQYSLASILNSYPNLLSMNTHPRSKPT